MTFGTRSQYYGYQYSKIFRSLMCIYFCGGSCIKDVTTHLMSHLPYIRHSAPVVPIRFSEPYRTDSEDHFIHIEHWKDLWFQYGGKPQYATRLLPISLHLDQWPQVIHERDRRILKSVRRQGAYVRWREFGLKSTSRIKTFVFKFISVPIQMD